jgi:hypothetical protein
MTDYAKISVYARVSEQQDYSDKKPEMAKTFELTPTACLYYRLNASTSVDAVDFLGELTEGQAIVINNCSETASEVVHVTFFQELASPGALTNVVCAHAIPDTIALAGQSWVTTYGAAAGQYVRVDSASNPGTYLISVAADALLTLAGGETLNAATENATLYFESKNTLVISAGGSACIAGNLVAEDGLLFKSESGTPKVEILILGV